MIALVPARGGSKGLPRKNLRMLRGEPLILHTLRCAQQALRIDRVVVSSDDEEIIALARGMAGVEAPFRRPAEFATDDASAIDVYLHAAQWLKAETGRGPQALCVLLPTAPLRTPADVDGAIALFERHRAAVVLSVAAAKPLAWHQRMAPDGKLTAVPDIEASIANRQALPPTVIPNGAIQVLDIESLAATRSYFGPRSYGYAMPAGRSLDIDTLDDLRIAEAMLAA